MSHRAESALVVIAVVMVLWTVAATVVAAKLWKLVEKMNAKLDQIAADLRSLSQKGEQLLVELKHISSSARNQVETVGTIVRDVRTWVTAVEATANLLSATVRHGVHSSFGNLRAFFSGLTGFMQVFMRRHSGGAAADETSTGKEN
ncbi:MAG: hypothetical protein HZA91_20045 [Verrucomicrobia bacterium]|nr:hypothetical protein [Verrucomicrobiota bacterium]